MDEGCLSILRPSGTWSYGDLHPEDLSGVSHSCQGQSHSECSCFHVVVMSSSSDQLTSILHYFLSRAAMNLFIYLFLVTEHAGSYFHGQGSNSWPLQWKHGILTTKLLGKSQNSIFISLYIFFPKTVYFP